VCSELTDRACIAFADALHRNTSLEYLKLRVSNPLSQNGIPGKDTYKAFARVLRLKWDLQAELDLQFIVDPRQRKDCDASRRDFEIQKRLNEAGRGQLFRHDSSKAACVEAMIWICDKDSGVVYMPDWDGRDSLLLHVGLAWDCLFTLIKANPSLCET